jgi:uncharacterized Zn finger protein
MEVARASREDRPQRALPVYVKAARQQIDQRNRKHYAQAAQLLKVVRNLYLRLNDEAGWQQTISGIRQEFRNLPALQDELNKAVL